MVGVFYDATDCSYNHHNVCLSPENTQGICCQSFLSEWYFFSFGDHYRIVWQRFSLPGNSLFVYFFSSCTDVQYVSFLFSYPVKTQNRLEKNHSSGSDYDLDCTFSQIVWCPYFCPKLSAVRSFYAGSNVLTVDYDHTRREYFC